ncbi:MAG TPA: hypothetical protein VJZ27_14140, partial [Aggregatilineales bacterium]|nr:hypothetical protein [Aggregatilineales bacterium]
MVIHSRKNQYRGVNAHHLSIFQNEAGDWESFHSDHITHIREHLRDTLPAGYIARTERSIQIL